MNLLLFRKLLLLALLSFYVVPNGQAQHNSQREYLLFEYTDRNEALEKMTAEEPEEASISLNREIAGGEVLNTGDVLRFDLKNTMQRFRITRKSRYVEKALSIHAQSEEHPDDYLLLTFTEQSMTGLMYTGSHSELYHFNYDRAGNTTTIKEEDPVLFGDFKCAVDTNFHSPSHPDPDMRQDIGKMKSGLQDQPLPSLQAIGSSLQDSVTIDVLIVYTQRARQWAASESESIHSEIAATMNLAQTIFDRSNTAVKLRLVHTHETDYDENSGNPEMSDHVQRFASVPGNNRFDAEHQGFMNEVHDLRNEYGADLMALLVDEPFQGGIGFVLRQVNGDPELGFSVSNVRSIAQTGVFSHEIGHNLGNDHARDQQEAPASARGGIFEFSTGYRFTTNNNQGNETKYSTIMAYTDAGEFQTIPRFSAPDVFFRDTPTGTYDPPNGPSDNSRSMKITKRLVSGYRQTQFEPPSGSVSANTLLYNMESGQSLQVPVIISNQGESDLIFDIDFKTGNISSGLKQSETLQETTIQNQPEPFSQILRQSSFPESRTTFSQSESDETILYQSVFDSGEGYSPGTYTATQEWRTFFSTDHTFKISNQNPSTGSNHLRVDYLEGIEDTTFVRSPYFGPQAFGAYEFTADVAIRDNDRQSPRFDLYLLDSRGESSEYMTAGVIFNNGNIFCRNAEGSFSGCGNYEPDTYQTLRIVTDPASDVIRYFYDGMLIQSTPFNTGINIGHFWVLNSNSDPDTWIDIDNIGIKRLYAPFEWLDLNAFGGIAPPGEAGQVMLEFSTHGIQGGSYNSTMVIRTNDPDNERIEIPIRLNVDLEVPDVLSLEQNFPNPFQRATTITFGIPEASHVQMDIYSVSGQRVKTILDETRPAGTYFIPFNAGDLASGVYIYRLRTDQGARDQKMVLIK